MNSRSLLLKPLYNSQKDNPTPWLSIYIYLYSSLPPHWNYSLKMSIRVKFSFSFHTFCADSNTLTITSFKKFFHRFCSLSTTLLLSISWLFFYSQWLKYSHITKVLCSASPFFLLYTLFPGMSTHFYGFKQQL